MTMALSGSAQAARGDIWLRCVLTETLTTSVPAATGAPTREDVDRVYLFVFNSRRDSLLHYEDGQLKDLNGLGLFDGATRTGSVVVTPNQITYNYSVAPDAAEFSQVIDRTTLTIEEHGTSFHDHGSMAGAPATRTWAGSGQCEKTRPLPLRKRQI
jgi:hypothetical protein